MMRGNGVKRQTIEAMNQMRLLVKVQTQIHARRVEMMESRASQPYHTSETEVRVTKKYFMNSLIAGKSIAKH